MASSGVITLTVTGAVAAVDGDVVDGGGVTGSAWPPAM